MCGIAGILSLNGRPIRAVPNLLRMSDAMAHRGPDGEGYLAGYLNPRRRAEIFSGATTPTSHGDVPYVPERRIETVRDISAEAFLAHRRLSILDLSSAGQQPMCTPDRRFWITYNGEIYNYTELKDELECRGHEFHTHCDTEVLLHGYQEWGSGVLEKTNGMFAFLIWDDQKKLAFCARDRLGIKPLYYYSTSDIFVFASDLKTLLASNLFEVQPDFEGLYHALSYGVAPRPLTSFRGIRALEPGHWRVIDPAGRGNMARYWKLPHGVQDLGMSETEAIEGLEERLMQSVKRRLISDVPVGTFMSGGIDSTTVSAMAAHTHGAICAFTLGFKGAPTHEVEQAKATAKKNDINHVVEFFDPKSAIARVGQMVQCYEEPFFSLSPNYLIAELVASHGIKVILNGLGGDELFAGYLKYTTMPVPPLWRRLAPCMKMLEKVWPSHSAYTGRLFPQYAPRFFAENASVFSNEEKMRLFSFGRSSQWNSSDYLLDLYLPGSPSFGDHIEALNYFDVLHTIGNHHLYRVDQFTMWFSIEGRFPMLDHKIVEFAFKIPSRFKIKSGERKYVLRRVAERFIDKTCLEMKKKGFGLPMKQWLSGPLKEFSMEKLSALKQFNIIEAREIDRYRSALANGNFRPYQIWMLVHLQLWVETFIERNIGTDETAYVTAIN